MKPQAARALSRRRRQGRDLIEDRRLVVGAHPEVDVLCLELPELPPESLFDGIDCRLPATGLEWLCAQKDSSLRSIRTQLEHLLFPLRMAFRACFNLVTTTGLFLHWVHRPSASGRTSQKSDNVVCRRRVPHTRSSSPKRRRSPMRRKLVIGIVLVALGVVGILYAQQKYPDAADPAVVLDNDQVVVQRVEMKPGEWVGEHSHQWRSARRLAEQDEPHVQRRRQGDGENLRGRGCHVGRRRQARPQAADRGHGDPGHGQVAD